MIHKGANSSSPEKVFAKLHNNNPIRSELKDGCSNVTYNPSGAIYNNANFNLQTSLQSSTTNKKI